jgi:hypothetical protein
MVMSRFPADMQSLRAAIHDKGSTLAVLASESSSSSLIIEAQNLDSRSASFIATLLVERSKAFVEEIKGKVSQLSLCRDGTSTCNVCNYLNVFVGHGLFARSCSLAPISESLRRWLDSGNHIDLVSRKGSF